LDLLFRSLNIAYYVRNEKMGKGENNENIFFICLRIKEIGGARSFTL